jgi:antibiotic biosynthesis monooxygenase (ABM) superfamily enzyme
VPPRSCARARIASSPSRPTRRRPAPAFRGYARRTYTSTFTFRKRQFDDAFHALDDAISQVARSTPGYLGEESWENPSSGLVWTVHRRETLACLRALMTHPAHVAAKQGQWLAGDQDVVARMLRSCGDGGIDHPLAGRAQPESGHAQPDR